MKIEIAIRDYMTEHEINNCSPATLKNQRRVLNCFARWLADEHGIADTDQLQVAHLRGWVSHLQRSSNSNLKRSGELANLKSSTVQQYAIIMLSFCHWLEHEEVIEKPFTHRFKLPKAESTFIATYTQDEVQALLKACESARKDRPDLCKALTARNRAIVSVFIDTGIRLKELVGLRLCDIDRDLRVLLVHRKGGKWQQVPISREGFKPLHEYLTKYRPYLARLDGITKARKEDQVFLSDSGEPLTRYGITGLFKSLKARAGIEDKRVGPHNCRRYMATTQLGMGRSPLDVQRQMGHTTLTMTNRYASLTVEQLQKSHEEYSPMRMRNNTEAKSFGTGYWEE